MRRVPLALGERSYDVVIGSGAVEVVDSLIPETAGRAVIVTQPTIPIELHLRVPSETVEIGLGEGAKSLETVERLCRRFVEIGITRADVIVGVGGGVVTDVAGFAAATFHRGVSVVHVPTTLVGQVDAALGGKTGINLPEGKNLIGAFWQPRGVICDTDALGSLPEAEWRSGYGEIVKCALMGLDDLLEQPLEEQIARCVDLKARIVAEDEREGGSRMLLNYGHTLAHALEAAGFAEVGDSPGLSAEGSLKHGEAVAIGLVFAARLAEELGRIGRDRVEQHEEFVARMGLPTVLPKAVDPSLLVRLMGRDKKSVNGLTFVLDSARGVEPVSGVPAVVVDKVLRAMPNDLTGGTVQDLGDC